MDKRVVHGTHKDPQLVTRDGVALTLANEDNMDRIMTDLEQSWKNVAQLKETLKKEGDESQKLKRKYELKCIIHLYVPLVYTKTYHNVDFLQMVYQITCLPMYNYVNVSKITYIL